MVSKELARCIARICGDGYLGKKYIRYANKNDELLKEFARDIKSCFDNVHLYWAIGNSGTPFIQLNRKKICSYFTEILPSYTSSKIEIPDVIKKSNLAIKKEFLRAYFDDEGGANLRIYKKTKEWKRDIKIASNSKKMLEDIKLILSQDFGIITNKLFRSSTKTGNKIDRTYHLIITGKSNLIKFNELIGFKSKYKDKELNLAISSYGKTHHRNPEGFHTTYRALLLVRAGRNYQNNKLYKSIL